MIANHSQKKLAQSVVDANSIAFIAPLLSSPDAKLRRQVCSALSQISKHTVDLAETVVEGEIFPHALNCLRDIDGFVRKNAATLICEIAKHTPEVCISLLTLWSCTDLCSLLNLLSTLEASRLLWTMSTKPRAILAFLEL